MLVQMGFSYYLLSILKRKEIIKMSKNKQIRNALGSYRLVMITCSPWILNMGKDMQITKGKSSRSTTFMVLQIA